MLGNIEAKILESHAEQLEMTDQELEEAVKSQTKNEPHKSNRHRYHSEVCLLYLSLINQ